MQPQPVAQPAIQIVLEDPVNWRSISLKTDPETGGYALIHSISVQEIERFPMLSQSLKSFNKAERMIYNQMIEQPNIMKCDKSDEEIAHNQQRVFKYSYLVREPVEIITRAKNLPDPEVLVRNLLQLIKWHSEKKVILTEIRPENIYVSNDGQRIYFGLFGSSLIKDLVATLQTNTTVTSASEKIKFVMKIRPTLAPEMVAQIQGSNSQAAIVYSIGSLLSRIYLKSYPSLHFESSIEPETNPNLIDHRHIPRISPPFVKEAGRLLDLIDNMVDKDPTKRRQLGELADLFGEPRGTSLHPVDFTSLAPGIFRQEAPFPAQVLVEHLTSLVQTWKEFMDSLRNDLLTLKIADEKFYRLYISSIMLVSAGFVNNLSFMMKIITQKKLVSGLLDQNRLFADDALLQAFNQKFQGHTRDLNSSIDRLKGDLDQVRSTVTIRLCEQPNNRWDSIDHLKKRVFYATIMRCAEYGAGKPPADQEVKYFQKMLFKLFWFICYERVFPVYIGKNNQGERVRFDWSRAAVAMTHPKEDVLIAELNNFGQRYASQIVKSNEVVSEFGGTTLVNPVGGIPQGQPRVQFDQQSGGHGGQNSRSGSGFDQQARYPY